MECVHLMYCSLPQKHNHVPPLRKAKLPVETSGGTAKILAWILDGPSGKGLISTLNHLSIPTL
jgi:hypothetical protein